jgi:hypothetical protein
MSREKQREQSLGLIIEHCFREITAYGLDSEAVLSFGAYASGLPKEEFRRIMFQREIPVTSYK